MIETDISKLNREVEDQRELIDDQEKKITDLQSVVSHEIDLSVRRQKSHDNLREIVAKIIPLSRRDSENIIKLAKMIKDQEIRIFKLED